MHPWTIAIAGAVALSLAGTSPGAARPKLGSTVMPEAAPVFWPDAPANLIEYLLFPKGPEERFWRYSYGAIMNAAFADPRPRLTLVAAVQRPPMPTPGSRGSNMRSPLLRRNARRWSSCALL